MQRALRCLPCFALLLLLGLSPAFGDTSTSIPSEDASPAPEKGVELDLLAEAIFMNHCSVTYTQCSSGPISCQGHSYCTSGSGYVECDGQRTYCPPCTAYCTRDNSPRCTGQTCQDGFSYAYCNGVAYECPLCPNPSQIICDP
jgi:hypothetical protein